MKSILTLTLMLLMVTPVLAQDDGLEGFGFGAGLAASWDFHTHDRVDDAIVDANGIVRINVQSNVQARFLLELHHFPWTFGNGSRGVGPFISVQPSGANIVETVAIGMLYGFKRSDSGASFNIGIGYEVDPSVQVLGDEFVANAPAPTGPDGEALPIRYMTLAQGGLTFLTSFSW